MKTLAFLLPLLCAAPTLAQPQGGGQMFPAQPPARPPQQSLSVVVPMEDIERELRDFARRFNAPALAANGGYGRLFGAQGSSFQAKAWARQTQELLDGATLRIESVRLLPRVPPLPRERPTTRALVSYRFEFPPEVSDQDRQKWERPRQEIVQLRWQGSDRDPDEVLDLIGGAAINGTAFAGYGWELVPPTVTPPALEKRFYASDQDSFWANIAAHLAPKRAAVLPGERSPGERSLAKLRQLAIGTQWLAQEHDERYALAPDFIQALRPYLQNVAAFSLPDLKEFYTFNSKLLDLRADQLTAPDKTVLFYEGQNQTPIFRYDGRAAIAFADGHAALVSPDEARQLIWKP